MRRLSSSWLSLWGGYISRIYPESTQELDQILGPFWFVYTTESSQDFKKVQTNQTGPRIWKTSWALSGLILVCLHFFQILGTFCFVNRPERAQNLIEFLGTFWVNSANVATPSLEYQENATQARIWTSVTSKLRADKTKPGGLTQIQVKKVAYYFARFACVFITTYQRGLTYFCLDKKIAGLDIGNLKILSSHFRKG